MNDSDIVVCKADRLIAVRRQLKLTQEDLAAEAGYSVRVVRKAEKGGQIRFATLAALVTALQRAGADVSVRDLCTDPVEIVQAFVEAYRVHEAGMVPKIRHLLSNELVTYVAGDPAQIPFAGTYMGVDGLQEFWDRFFALIERYDKNALNLQYFVCGDEVVAYGTEKGRLHGQITDEPAWLCLKFDVSDGCIVRFEDYFDTASAQASIKEFQRKMNTDEEAS